jgi:hypothetical protein
MTDQLKRLQQNYRARFLRYLSRRDELALWSAYELGREGLSGGVSLLDVVQIHHRVLVDVLRDTGGSELQDVAEAATTFLLEVLASFEMTRRGFFDAGAGAEAAGDPPRDLPR